MCLLSKLDSSSPQKTLLPHFLDLTCTPFSSVLTHSLAYHSLILSVRRLLQKLLELKTLKRVAEKLKRMARKTLLNELRMVGFVKAIRDSRNRAAILIQSAVRSYLTRKRLKPFTILGTQRAFLWRGKAEKVELRAEFTTPPWTVAIPLCYNAFIDAFATDYMLATVLPPSKYLFKFIADGQWVCGQMHQTELDQAGNENNYIDLRNLTRSSRSRSRYARFNKSIANLQVISTQIRAACKGKAEHVKRSEDAYFVSESLKVCGVADGVGSWGCVGVDPSLFSNELISNSLKVAKKYSQLSLPLTADILREIAREAHKKATTYGSSTLVLASVVNSCLHYLSIGDSRVAILRESRGRYKLHYISKEQQHSFNCPYQLSNLPTQRDFERLRCSGHGKLVSYMESHPRIASDTVNMGHVGSVLLQKHDLVLLGSDGLFDNLGNEKIIDIVTTAAASDPVDLAQQISSELLVQAFHASCDPSYKSPFSIAAKLHGKEYSGGKPDDITVVALLNS